ncbi:MAG: ABC transporter permease [Ruminiclostridium sp.]|nr:ABC transporter permease [Ruminiclostridium sp.]
MNLQTFKLAVKSISARKGRTFLTMLGVIIGLAAVIIMVSYTAATTKQMLDMMKATGTNQLEVYAYKWSSMGDEDTSVFDAIYGYCQRLDDLVIGVTPQQDFWGRVQYGTMDSQSSYFDYSDPDHYSPNTYMVSNQWGVCNNAVIAKGRDFTLLDIQRGNQVCVLGSRAAKIFFNYADPIGKTMTFDGVPYTVIGVYEPRFDEDSLPEGYEYYLTQDNFILIPYTTSRALRLGGSNNVNTFSNQFYVKCRGQDETMEASSRLNGFLKGLIGDSSTGNAYGSYSIYNRDQYISNTEDANRSQQLLMGGIAAISLLVGGIGIMNIMLVTVTERTREIGIRKAIGAERRTIIFQFLLEACMICGIGGILGILAGYVGTLIVCKQTLNLIMLPNPDIAGIAFAISVGIGIIFGLYPAIKASGLQPVEALRAD